MNSVAEVITNTRASIEVASKPLSPPVTASAEPRDQRRFAPITGVETDSIEINTVKESEQFTLELNENQMSGIPIRRNEDMEISALYTLLFMALFAIIRFRGKDLVFRLFKASWSDKQLEDVLGDGIVNNIYYYLIALFLSSSVGAVALSYYLDGMIELAFVGRATCIILAFHFLMIGIIELLGWTFSKRSTAREAIGQLWAMNIISGFSSAPFVLAMLFMKTFAVEGMLNILAYLGAGLLLFRLIRWIGILFSNRVPFLYIVLYLCALEIVPLIAVFRIVLGA